MRDYELVMVLQPGLEDEGVKGLVEQVSTTITERGGQVTQVGQLINDSGQIAAAEPWKRRRLAYPIRKAHEGYYPVLRLQAEPKVLPELEQKLKLNEDVLRYLLVRLDE